MNTPDWKIRRQQTKGGPRVDIADRLARFSVQRAECLIWTGTATGDGYGVIGIGRGRQYRVHRVAWELKHGAIPEGKLLCHKCDTPLCINVDHLFLGSPKDNTVDMWQKGRHGVMRGECHPRAKLTDSQIEHIQSLRRAGNTLKSIAALFDVSFQWVSHVCRKGRARA